MTTKAIHGEDKRVQITLEDVEKMRQPANWYYEKIDIPAGAQALLDEYSGFAPNHVITHVKDLVSSSPITNIIDPSPTRLSQCSSWIVGDSVSVLLRLGHTLALDT